MAKATISISERLNEKTALALYTNYLIYRYSFSRVVAESLYRDAKYFQLLFGDSKREDGQIIYQGVCNTEPAGKELKSYRYVSLKLTLRHPDDRRIRAEKGIAGFRRHILKRITEEAEVQGGTLTQEDCADILNTDRSTIIRDIAALKSEGEDHKIISSRVQHGRNFGKAGSLL